MGSLGRLGELHGIADENDVSCRRPHRDQIGERDLPRLVHEEIVKMLVEVVAREQPSGSADHRIGVQPLVLVIGGGLNSSAHFGVILWAVVSMDDRDRYMFVGG